MQEPLWHTSTHCGESKWPSQSLHFVASILKTLPLWLIALFGHAFSHKAHDVQVSMSTWWGTSFSFSVELEALPAIADATSNPQRSVQDTHGSMLLTMMAMSAILALRSMNRSASQFMKLGTRHFRRSGCGVSLVLR
jgi:hypothetical protein